MMTAFLAFPGLFSRGRWRHDFRTFSMPKPFPDDAIRRLAEAVASGLSVRAAAKSLGVPERTARRWAKLPKYQRYLAELRKETFNRVVDRMALLVLNAQSRVAKMLGKDKLDDEVTVRALSASTSGLVALVDRLGPAAGPSGASGGLTVPRLDVRFEQAPEAAGGEGDPCQPTPE
jgi:hypothetical protein